MAKLLLVIDDGAEHRRFLERTLPAACPVLILTAKDRPTDEPELRDRIRDLTESR